MNHSREIEPELLQQLGLVIVRWSLVEGWVSDLLAAMVKGDRASMMVITANVSQSSITGWIRTLLDIENVPDNLAKEIRDVLTEIDELRNERNTLVHGLWGTAGPDNSVLVQTVKIERNPMIRDLVVTTADLHDLVDRIVEVINRLRPILHAFGAYP